MKIEKYYLDGCAPCNRVTEILKDIDVEVEEIEMSNNSQEYIQKYQLKNVPTLLFIKDGIEYSRLEGEISREQIINVLTS